MKQLLLILLLFAGLGAEVLAQTPAWEWARSASNFYGNYSSPNCIGTDKTGNIYTAGGFGAGATFDTTVLTKPAMVFAKYNPEGNLLWVKQMECSPRAMYTDQEGNCYLTGLFGDTLHLGGATIISQGYGNIFVAKFDNEGNALWARHAGSPNSTMFPDEIREIPYSIAADSAGNSYLGIHVRGSDYYPAIFDSISVYPDLPTPNWSRLISVLVKYNDTGAVQWVRKIDGVKGEAVPWGVAVTAQGDCYTTGTLNTSFTIDSQVVSTQGMRDVCLIRFDTNGNLVWVKTFGGPTHEEGFQVAVNPAGEIYISGIFNESVHFGNFLLHGGTNGQRLYLVKCDSDGTVLWASQTTTGNGYIHVPRLVIDSTGSSYIAARFAGTIGVGQLSLTTSPNTKTPVYIKWDGNGIPVWALQAPGNGWSWPYGIALSPDLSACYTYGFFEVSRQFGSTTLTAIVFGGDFLAKIGNILTAAPSLISEPTWAVYPNPASRQLHLKLPVTAYPARAVLTDVRGQAVYLTNLTASPEASLNLPPLPQGVYILSVETEKEVLRKKVMIE